MANLGIVRARVKQMVAADEPSEDIKAYIASQGATVDEVRNYQPAPLSKEAMAFDPGIKGDYLSESYNPETGYVEPSKTQSFIEGAGNNITLGFGDEMAALPISMLKGQTYEDTLKKINRQQEDAKFHNPKSYLGGQVAGSIAQGVALAPLSATARGYQAGAGMTKLMGLSGLDAGIISGLSGVGEGKTLEERAKKGAIGTAIGVGTGLVSPLATSLLGTLYQGTKGAFGIGDLDRAKRAIAETLLRSGKPAKDVVDEVTQATAEGQPMYALADALDYEGQRRLSGVTRIPGPQRNKIVKMLDKRQFDQAPRTQDFIERAYDTTGSTALKKAAADTTTRRVEGKLNYDAARAAAGAVDTSAALKQLDDILTPGVTKIIGKGTAAEPGVFSKVKHARDLLTDGNAQLTDFDSLLAAKIQIKDMMDADKTLAVKLEGTYNALDDALAKSSPPYANARDTYRLQSEGIEAIEAGKKAAQGGRYEDTTSLFGSMKPHQQEGFRAGYPDPLIAKIQSARPTTDVATPLLSTKRTVELPAFAAPGKGDQLLRQLERESKMFETRAAARGGSATAQNIADNVDTSNVGMLVNLATNPKAALMQGAAQLAAGAQGLNETTRGFMADMLMKTDPQEVQKVLEAAMGSGEKALKARALLNMMFNQAAPKAAAPFVEPMLPQ